MRRLTAIIALAVLGCVAIPATLAPAQKLMVFGGSDHRTYLGCLSCSKESPESVFNPESPYGSCQPLSDNLFCRRISSRFGAPASVSQLSACSPYSDDPPVIVDERGGYYGRFSVGGVATHRDAVCALFGRYKDDGLCKLVNQVCEG